MTCVAEPRSAPSLAATGASACSLRAPPCARLSHSGESADRAGMRKSTVIAASVAALVAGTATAVWASTLTLSSKHLGTASVVTPPVFPKSLSTGNGGGTAGRVQRFDTLTVTYSDEIQASSMCSGAPTTVGTQTLNGATVTVGNNTGSTGADALTVTVPGTTCPGGIHFGSVDLGSASYVS